MAERVWASDTIDALERQTIEAGTGLLLPPEMVGSHIGAPPTHTTGRTHVPGFRAGTAFFPHLGIEWDLTSADDGDLAALAAWITAHKTHRHLLHHGTVCTRTRRTRRCGCTAWWPRTPARRSPPSSRWAPR